MPEAMLPAGQVKAYLERGRSKPVARWFEPRRGSSMSPGKDALQGAGIGICRGRTRGRHAGISRQDSVCSRYYDLVVSASLL
jgi:hypothetical protein